MRSHRTATSYPTITLTSRPQPHSRIYRRYQLAINGKVVREQITPFGREEIRAECECRHMPAPPQYATPLPSQPATAPERRLTIDRMPLPARRVGRPTKTPADPIDDDYAFDDLSVGAGAA